MVHGFVFPKERVDAARMSYWVERELEACIILPRARMLDTQPSTARFAIPVAVQLLAGWVLLSSAHQTGQQSIELVFALYEKAIFDVK